jgi:hypothetical protein
MDIKAKRYWKIDTFDDEIWIHADFYKIENECLNLYVEEKGLLMSFSKNYWNYIIPASVLDGGCPYIEHIVPKGEDE